MIKIIAVLFFDGTLIGKKKVDFLIENGISFKLKAVHQLDNSHLNRALNYLDAFNLEIRRVINFGSPKPEFRRIMNNKYKPKAE